MKLFIVMIIIFLGIYFSIKLRFQNLNVFNMLKKIGNDNSKISNFSSLCLSLSSKIGVGSIAGVSVAIFNGGLGTIFWMWITTILISSNTTAETILALKYRKENIGGPFYYIKYGLNNKFIAIIYAIIFLLSYLFGFLPIQVNTISKTIINIIDINYIFIGIIISILILFIICGGINRISNVLSKLLPLISFVYIFTCLIIIFKNINMIDNIIGLIIKDAFNIKNMLFGFIVGSIKTIFSTESGLGTNAIASASVSSNDVLASSLSQTFGTYFDTFVITTLTAFVIILSPYNLLDISDINGIEIILYAFIYHLGKIGGFILILSILLFAFVTIISCYYYIEVAFKFLFNKENIVYKIIFIIIVFISIYMSPTIIWNLIDIFIIILGIINVIALFKLRNDVKL